MAIREVLLKQTSFLKSQMHVLGEPLKIDYPVPSLVIHSGLDGIVFDAVDIRTVSRNAPFCSVPEEMSISLL